jgi:hypothetical protein
MQLHDVVDDVLGPISVVHINVKDGHAANARHIVQGVKRTNGHGVQNAKTATGGAVAADVGWHFDQSIHASVVTWRTHNA